MEGPPPGSGGPGLRQRELAALLLAAPAGRRLFLRLAKRCGSLRALLDASFSWLLGLEPRLGENQARALAGALDHPDLDSEIALANRLGARWVALGSPGYPENLAEGPCPPPILCVRGDLAALARASVAVVGSRKPADYGLRVARDLGEGLAKADMIVVSGLAQGIDQAAMRAAARAGGRTVGVLGCGLATVYPPSAERDSGLFLERGAFVSEYPLRTPPARERFPKRNSIIAAMTLGTCVVEAAQRSGSFITARCALDANRSVFAVPGDIYRPTSRGADLLIREGAQLVMGARHILQDLAPRLRQVLDEEQRSDALREALAAAEKVRRADDPPAPAPTPPKPEPRPPEPESQSQPQFQPEPEPKTFSPETLAQAAAAAPSPRPPEPAPALPPVPKPLPPPPPVVPKPKPPPSAVAPLRPAPKAIPEGVSEFHRAILERLGSEKVHLDELLRCPELGAADGGALSLALLDLEMEGLAKQLPGKLYVRT